MKITFGGWGRSYRSSGVAGDYRIKNGILSER
jgi:hypothetical protein